MTRHVCPQSCSVEGNNGGSYVTLRDDGREGFAHLEVGETCARTVRMEISVVALAAILTWAKDYGFSKILAEYWPNREPGWELDQDPIVSRRSPKEEAGV